MKKVEGLPFLTRRAFTEHYAKKQNIPFAEAEQIVKVLLVHMLHHLYDGKRIELRGFGVFGSKKVDAYQGRHPRTGEKLMIPARTKITFKVSKVLLKRIEAQLMGGK